MSDAYTEALKEAFATADSSVAVLDTIEVFHPSLSLGKPNLQLSVVFDRTGSQQNALATIKSVVASISVRMLATFDSVEFSLLTYESEGVDTVLVTGNTFVDEPTFQTAVDGVSTSGGTEHVYAALKLAADSLNWATDGNTVKAMLLITDEDNDSHSVSEQDAIDALAAHDIQFLLGFADSNASWFPNLATGTGFTHVDTFDNTLAADQLEAALNDLITFEAQDAFYLVKDLQGHNMTLENNETKYFEASGFKIELPEKNEEGVQDLTIAIDNTDLKVSDFIKEALKIPNQPIQIKYRPYLSNDFSRPQLDPPLVLYLSEVSIDRFEVTGRASFADILNKKFLTEKYTATRFPGL